MKIDRRMPAFAWSSRAMKLLLRIAASRVENGQTKMFRALRCHQVFDEPRKPLIRRDRPMPGPRISAGSHPLGRAVSRGLHAGSRLVSPPAVVPGSLSESVQPESPFEPPERIVSLRYLADFGLQRYWPASLHSRLRHCQFSDR